MPRTPDDGRYVIDPPEYVPNEASVGVNPAALRAATPDARATMARPADRITAAVHAATKETR